MVNKAKILCFAGSTRNQSVNKKLVKVAMQVAQDAGAEVTYIDLKDLPMPLYDGDLEAEQGLPDNAKKFKELLKSHDAMLISCPEYNSSITPVLKNAIDWASRPQEGEKPLVCFTGKVAGLMAASPGALGGLRGLVAVRSLLGNIGVTVIPDQVAVPQAMQAFDDNGNLVDEKQKASVQKVGAKVAEVAAKLKS